MTLSMLTGWNYFSIISVTVLTFARNQTNFYVYDEQSKSPQERALDDLEKQIKAIRERTEKMQHEWLRVQGLVVKQTEQHHKIITDINLLNKRELVLVHTYIHKVTPFSDGLSWNYISLYPTIILLLVSVLIPQQWRLPADADNWHT